MPGSNRTAYGNEIYDVVIAPTSIGNTVPGTITWNPTNIGATATAELTTSIPGLLPGDQLYLALASGPITTGLSITNTRVTAAGLLAVTWVNSTAGSLAAPTAVWNAELVRPESSTLPPNAI